MTRFLGWAGVAGPTIFVGVFLLLGANRAEYNPVYTFVSQLALDGGGWMQTLNFVVSGLLIVVFGIAVGGRASTRLQWWSIVLIGLGLLALAVFEDNPSLRYPPGAGDRMTWPPVGFAWGHLILGGIGVVGGLLIAAASWAWRFARDGRQARFVYTVLTLILVPVLYVFALWSGAASGTPGALLNGYAGLLQRASLMTEMLWILLLALWHTQGTTMRPT
jgi:hypothetical protein